MTNMATLATALAVVVSAFACPQSSSASDVGGMEKDLRSVPAIKYILVRGPAAPPTGHLVFCLRLPAECKQSSGPDIAKIDSKTMAKLQLVNDTVNRTIRPKNENTSEINRYVDDWELSPTSGDCEDYAITKRHQLISRGWPARTLRLAVVKTPWGDTHAVLVVRTSDGDLILDNLTNAIKPFQQTGLRFLEIQSQENPRIWLALR